VHCCGAVILGTTGLTYSNDNDHVCCRLDSSILCWLQAVQRRVLQASDLAYFDDDFIIGDCVQVLHDALHLPQDVICRLKRNTSVLVQYLHQGSLRRTDLLQLKFDGPLGAYVPVSWEYRALGDVFQETGLASASATDHNNRGQLKIQIDVGQQGVYTLHC